MTDRDKLGDWATGTMLVGTGVLGLLYEAAHIFGGEWLVNHLGSQQGALIFLVSLLCVGLGLERLLILHKVRASIEVILETVGDIKEEVTTDSRILNEMNTAEPLIGAKDIATTAIGIINNCANSDVINATSQYASGIYFRQNTSPRWQIESRGLRKREGGWSVA